MLLFNLHSHSIVSHPQLNILWNGWTNAYQGNGEHLCVFKWNQVIVCSSCTTLTELTHITFPCLFFSNTSRDYWKKRGEDLGYLSKQAHLAVCVLLNSTRLHKLMWTVLLHSWLQSIPSTKVLIRELSDPSPVISIPCSLLALNTSSLLPLTSREAFLCIHRDTGARMALTGTSVQCLQVPFHWVSNRCEGKDWKKFWNIDCEIRRALGLKINSFIRASP